MHLTKLTPTGKYEDAEEGAQLANFFLPAILIGLMFMVIMVGATPAMQGVVEEKGQRIAEVLLGSVSPFELMAGQADRAGRRVARRWRRCTSRADMWLRIDTGWPTCSLQH